MNKTDDGDGLEKRPPPAVWCGGDASCSIDGNVNDSSQTTVESANDGKTAAYHIHEYLQVYYIIKYNNPYNTIVYVIIALLVGHNAFYYFAAIVRLPETNKRNRWSTAVGPDDAATVARLQDRNRRRGLIRPDVRVAVR